MFSRRRSRGHYDPQQYNAGGPIRPASASSSAAANAFYQRQLGPSAAAEALRRHSLDQAGANAVRDFQQGGRSNSGIPAVAPRRANSLTTRSYQVVHTTPQRNAASRGRSPSLTSSPSLSAGSQRRNSMSSDRANSLTRTHTVVNRDASGRTLSLTTTTVRQMGSFELVSTKDVPIYSPGGRLSRPSQSFNSDFGSRANSLQSMDSELMGIREEPEEHEEPVEDFAALEGRLNKLGDPIDIPIAEEPEAEEEAALNGSSANFNRDINSETRSADELSDGTISNGTVSDATASPDSNRSSSRPSTRAYTQTSHSPPKTQTVDSDPTNNNEDLQAPSASEPLHREVSPARSALRNSNGSVSKTKVSFGGTEEPYVYESYEYDEEKPPQQPAQTSGAAAAAAVARSRNQANSPANPSHTSAYNPNVSLAAAQNQSRRRLVMSQPVFNVEKRPSQTSLSGRTASVRKPATNSPYPHTRPWDVQSEGFVDAVSSPGDIPVPARSSARPKSTVNAKPAAAQRGPSLGGLGGSANVGLNGLPKNAEDEPQEDQPQEEDRIRTQAIALAQAAFNNQSSAPSASNKPQQPQQAPAPQGPSHHYRSLVEDDASSIKSDSSFTRERRRGGGGGLSSAGSGPSRMRSLRQSTTPTLRNGVTDSKKGRKSSLLNQSPPNLDVGSFANASPSAGSNANNRGTVGGGPGDSAGFRTFSLRQNSQPDPSLFGNPKTRKSKTNNSNNGGMFQSRIADSDSEDEGSYHNNAGNTKSKNTNGKISLGGVFSPNTDVKDLFKSRATSDSAVVATSKPKKKSGGGFFKRMFGRKSESVNS